MGSGIDFASRAAYRMRPKYQAPWEDLPCLATLPGAWGSLANPPH